MIVPEPSMRTERFWSAAKEHRLLLLVCEQCETWPHPQATVCPCGSSHLHWKEASGKATLVSYAVVHTAPAFVESVPYTLLIVKLLEGPHLISALPGGHHTLHARMPLTVTYDDISPQVTLVRFTPNE